MLGLGTAIVTSGMVLDSALLDDFGGAAVGYSVRRLNSDYYGPCMRVRRDSDNAERDIYFGADDVLDTATLEDFCDGTDGYVVRWYNQTESYESVKLLNQSYASSPEAAYSVRKLDNSYDGPCMEVASSDDVIGFRMTADLLTGGQWLRYNVGGVPYTGGDTTWTAEMYVDAPSHIAENKAFRIRGITKGSSGTLFGTFGVVNPVEQKKWKKVTWTFSEAPTETFIQLQHDQGAGTQLRKGDQVLFRNIEATGYTAVYDENNYLVSDDSTAEVIKGYNIPFTADGDLDEAKIVEHGYASPFECLEIDVADTTDATGNYNINIPAADTITGDPSASGTFTVTTEIYVDCPSISGAVSFKGQIGTSTKNFDEGNTVAQKQWVTRTMSGTVDEETDVSTIRIYFAGTGQVAQELDEGDKIYFRKITLNHSEDSTYNAEYDFTSSAEGVTYSFPSGGNGDATLSHGKAPAEELGVITWYDQSGNGNDATQTTFADTPSIYQYNSTTKDYRVVKENDSPALTDFVEGDGMDFSTTISVTDQSIIFVGEVKTDSILIGNDDYAFWTRGAETTFRVNGTFHKFNASTRSAHTHLGYYRDGSTVSAFQDGSSLGTANGTPASDAASDYTGIAIYGRADANLGKYQEVIIFGEDLSSNRSDIEDNIDAHFRITNDLDATQSDDAKQPQVVDNGSTVTEGGQPALEFDGTDDDLRWAEFNQDGDFYNLFVHRGSFELNGSDTGNYQARIKSGGLWFFDGTQYQSPTTSPSILDQYHLLSYQQSSGALRFGVDGTSYGSLSRASGDYYVGGFRYAADEMNGKTQEVIFYSSDQSSNRTNIEDNINDFYSIYDKSSYRLLDYYRDAAAAFSLRKLLSTYTGSAIEVRRDDNTTQDIGFTASGDLDTAALATFCGSSDGFVKTWYDQSGNSNDATQTTQSLQPKIYDGADGVVTDNNGKPTTSHTADSLVLGTEIFLRSDDPDRFLISFVAEITDGADDGNAEYFSGGTASPLNFFRHDSANSRWNLRRTNEANTGNVNSFFNEPASITEGEIASFALYADSDEVHLDLNGQKLKSSGGTAWASDSDGRINFKEFSGTYDGNSQFNKGMYSEIIVWENYSDGDVEKIQDDVNNYYGIYKKTKLLDFHPDAAAAYSLRKLMGHYSGSAIEVRRDLDDTTQDIGFNANGDLDTAALAAFCGSSNGFVKTWYDQSVNGNDATQATPANQPKIYDATTGVIKDNGKPATEWSGAANQLLDTSYTTNSSEFTVVAVANADDNATNKTIVLTPEALVFVSNNESARHIQGDALQTPYSPEGSTDQMLHFVGNSGSESFAGDNGTAFTTRSESPATNSKLRIGANANGSINFLGTIQEIVYYASDQSGSRSDIEANVNRYYSIY